MTEKKVILELFDWNTLMDYLEISLANDAHEYQNMNSILKKIKEQVGR